MDVSILLLMVLIICVYALWLGLAIRFRLQIDASWAIVIGLFFELAAFIIGKLVDPDFPFLSFLIPILLAISFPAIIRSPAKVSKSFSDPGVWAWLVFLMYCALSLLWSSDPGYGISKLQIILLRGFIPGLFTALLYRVYGKLSWGPILLAGSVYALLTLLLGQSSPEYPDRLALAGANPIWAGRLALLLVAVALWNTKWSWWVKIPAAGLGFLAALATQSRGPLVSFVVASVLVLIIPYISARKEQLGKGIARLAMIVVACLLALIVLAQFILPALPGLLDTDRLGTLTSLDQLQVDDNVQGRMLLQALAIDAFASKPLTGMGLGGVAYSSERDYPHNLILEIMSELGIFGLALWAIVVGLSFYAAQGNRLLQVLLIQTFFYSLFSGDLGFNYEFVIFSMTVFALGPFKLAVRSRELQGVAG